MSYVFSDLLLQAVAEWPQLVCADLAVQKDNGYTVVGLGAMEEEISDKYIGTNEEIIFCNLHAAIAKALHYSSRSLSMIRPSDLRPSFIRERFEESLMSAINIPELGYSHDDMKIIKEYFMSNK